MNMQTRLLVSYYEENARKRKLATGFFMTVLAFYDSQCPERSVWVKHWIARRKEQGVHHNLFVELQLEDPMKYRRCLRMTTAMFEDFLAKVSPFIRKRDTHLRKSIPPAERLSLTLRHLATGESQESLSLSFRMGQSTISGIIKETVRAIYKVLKDEYLKFPSSLEEWKAVAHDFNERWNFPNCLGAMDGKHFVLEHPLKSGSMYFNYKGTFSVVLLAIVDAQLRFVFIDAGANGRVSDRGIWNNSDMKKYVVNSNFPLAPLPGTNVMFPYVIVGDEGFTLSEKVMIPFPKASLSGRMDRKIFNYRLSRARRCSENAFGILVTRFHIFRAPMRYDPQDAKAIILASCALHNWLRTDIVGRAMYSPPQYVDNENVAMGTVQEGEWRQANVGTGVVGLVNQGGNSHPVGALELRDCLCTYVNGVGAVPWQNRMIRVPQQN